LWFKENKRGKAEKVNVTCKCCKKNFEVSESTQSRNPRQYCSLYCSHKSRRKCVRPSKKDLENQMQNMSWLELGRNYGVSDNAVRKWARQYGLI